MTQEAAYYASCIIGVLAVAWALASAYRAGLVKGYNGELDLKESRRLPREQTSSWLWMAFFLVVFIVAAIVALSL